MRLPRQPAVYDAKLEQQKSSSLEREFSEIKSKLAFFTTGVGLPNFTPTGRALYLRQDGGAGSTLYVYEGASWSPK